MQDRQILNDRMQLPCDTVYDQKEVVRAKQLIQYIARTAKPETTTQPEREEAETTIPEPHAQETLERADAYAYSDDAKLVTGQVATPQIAQKLENYSTVTESRNVGISDVHKRQITKRIYMEDLTLSSPTPPPLVWSRGR